MHFRNTTAAQVLLGLSMLLRITFLRSKKTLSSEMHLARGFQTRARGLQALHSRGDFSLSTPHSLLGEVNLASATEIRKSC